MAKLDAKDLKSKYSEFRGAVISVRVDGKDFDKSKSLAISNVDIELSSGFEASIASFCIYNAFSMEGRFFAVEEAKKFFQIGSMVELLVGYYGKVSKVFVGVITRVRFEVPRNDLPYIEVTSMDVKSLMMANNHSKALTAKNYGDAVSEILKESVYQNLSDKSIITGIHVDDTPDKKESGGGGEGQEKASDRTMEFVAESDYDFIVRAAKKYNYEFFVQCGEVYFRKAKPKTDPYFTITPSSDLIRSFSVEYDVTGLVETVETRGMDTGKAKVITGKAKFSNKISLGSKAKALIKKTEKVYIDPTITSKEEADARAASLLEDISYRYGSMEMETIGIPELFPGSFIEVKEIGDPVNNAFYLTKVRHQMLDDGHFITSVTGKCAKLKG